MATQLRIKRRTADATAPAGLTAGEMAINLFDKKLYIGGTAGTNVVFLDSTSVGASPLAFSVITADQTAAINTGYIANKGTLLTLTLPTTAAVGSVIRVSGMNAGLWKIAQNASGIIHFGKTDTTTGVGGYISSTLARDAVELVCCVANNEWNVISSVGNITIV